jgi:hypothetical protein
MTGWWSVSSREPEAAGVSFPVAGVTSGTAPTPIVNGIDQSPVEACPSGRCYDLEAAGEGVAMSKGLGDRGLE